MENFPINEQPQAVFEGEVQGGALGALFGERCGHAEEFQTVQCLKSGLDSMLGCLQ